MYISSLQNNLNPTSINYKHMQEIKTSPELSVVMPAYNEGLIIEDYIAEILQSLEKTGYSYEVIVVDDGSTDLTGERAKEQGAKVISLRTNLGKGAALKAGFTFAKGDIIITLDADGRHDPKEIPILIKSLWETDADVVVGTRFGRKADIRPYSVSAIARIGNLLLNVMFSLLAGRIFSDSQSGFRVYRRNVLQELELDSQGFEIEAEIMFKALRKGFVYCEVPITSRTRLSRKIRFLDGFRILKRLIALRFEGL